MTAVFCGFTGSFRQKSAISANVTVGYSWHLDLSRVPPLLAEGIQLLQLLRVCHVQQGSPSPAQRVLGKWITTLHTKIKMKAKKTPTVKQEGLSGFFFSLLCREETLHHTSSYREVSEETTCTFTAQCVPYLLPAHRYKLSISYY